MNSDEPHNPQVLVAPGRRSGTGASSVLPYLARSFQTNPNEAAPREPRPSASAKVAAARATTEPGK